MNIAPFPHEVRFFCILFMTAISFAGCATKDESVDHSKLNDFGHRYAEAWGSQDAATVASFFAPSGSLQINDGAPSIGREAITVVAQSFMTTLPDMVLLMDSLDVQGEGASFYWTLIATNSGPGGNGNSVKISGYEQWTFDSDGLIARSLGHMDTAEYERQLEFGYTELLNHE